MDGRKEGNVLFNDTEQILFYGYMDGRKEGNVLFNNALNTFYLHLFSFTTCGIYWIM